MANYTKKLYQIDLSLAALCDNAKLGQTLTNVDIADVCECSSQTINKIYQSGLKKLRRTVNMSEHLGD